MVTELLKSLGLLFGAAEVLPGRDDRIIQPDERRRAARYPTVANGGLMGWREEELFLEIAAHVDDISYDGAKVTVLRMPPRDEPLWLRLESPGGTGWCPVKVVHHYRSDARAHLLGLRFPDSCSYELFVGLRGFNSDTKLKPRSPGFDSPHRR